MNKYDSSIIKTMLSKEKFEEVTSPEDADFILLNTCAVREHAEKRVIGRLNSLKNIKTKKPDTIVGVIGCMAKDIHNLIHHPTVDFLAPPDSYRNLANWMKSEKKGLIPEVKDEEYNDIIIENKKIGAYLSITRGCDYFCSYCIVPYTRGKIRSRPPDDIIKEAESLSSGGVREITLLGQNINAYRYKGIDFPEILKRVASIRGIKRLSFLTSHPEDIPSNLFSVMANSDNITNYLHLPLQSGSDRILKRMNRRYALRDYIDIISKAHKLMPDLTLTTDLIVGFPGEEEDDYQKTLTAVKEIGFDQAYMFAYSKRKRTLANLFPDQVEEALKKARLQRLIEVQNRITEEKVKHLLGRKMEVLVVGDAKRGGKLGKNSSGRIIIIKGVAKIGSLYIVRINDINGRVPIGVIKKEV